jgi:GNAT superfamily N-acetyltransferase
MAAAATEEYTTKLLQPPIPPALQAAIYELLLGYGPHYPEHFGPDMRARLAAAPGQDGAGLVSAVALDASGEVVCHACTMFDPRNPTVGLFGAVFTHTEHRQRGLSTKVVTLALKGAAPASQPCLPACLPTRGACESSSG